MPNLQSARRELGSVYTPREIAGRMVRACLDRWCELEAAQSSHNHQTAHGCRVLDPACGDGAFLLEAFDELYRRAEPGERDANFSAAARSLSIARDQIFGVDIDPAAIGALRDALIERLCALGAAAGEAASVAAANFRCGDSLSGPDFSPPRSELFAGRAGLDSLDTPHIHSGGTTPRAVDWRHDFPAAAAAGGFDLVIGNPPYLREKNAKPLFDAIARTDLGRRWREARMDLWFYFVHRSLDLLRPGGILSFIVSSYWLSSRSARRLIARLERETCLEEIVLFDTTKVFSHVAGRHMIFRLRKTPASRPAAPEPSATPCRITPVMQQRISRRTSCASGIDYAQSYLVPQAELFQHGRIVVTRPDAAHDAFRGRPTLGEFFDTRQGMAENPPFVNRRLHRELGGAVPTGAGVFVLRADEIDGLGFSAAERVLLRPYFETSAIGRYEIPDGPTHRVLYLARRRPFDLDGFPNIAAHLTRFRSILERRREVREGSCPWWELHWPRDEQIFLVPRILSVQMGALPQFAFAERPTFVGFSINLVLARDQACGLDALTGILNSKLSALWFERHAKRRGKNLEINAHVLREFPLPARNAGVERRLGELVRRRQTLAPEAPSISGVEREIEELVERLYARCGTDQSRPRSRGGAGARGQSRRPG